MGLLSVTGKTHFKGFETGTCMSVIHSGVIDILNEWAIEKPEVDANIITPSIILVDSNGKATRAVAGTDYMSPDSTTTLNTKQAINLGEAGYISGNGNGQFVTLSATTISATTINVLGTNTLINATSIEAGSFQGGTGSFTTVTATAGMTTPTLTASTEVNTPLVTATNVNTSVINGTGANGALTVNVNGETMTVNGTVKTDQLILGNKAITAITIATISFSETAPTTTGAYTLWVNTSSSSQVLSYLSVSTNAAATSWVPLGAVFK